MEEQYQLLNEIIGLEGKHKCKKENTSLSLFGAAGVANSNIKTSRGYTKEHHYAHSNKVRKLLEGATKDKRTPRQILRMDKYNKLISKYSETALRFSNGNWIP